MNNQNPQMPPNQHQVPDHRITEMAEKLRQMELQNTQLRTQIDMLAQRNQPQQNSNEPDPGAAFQPEVKSALDKFIETKMQSRLSQLDTQYRQQIGMLYDRLDEANYQLKYGGDKYKDLAPKVEQLRQQYQAQNQYITREEALRIVHFEESGKKQLNPDPAQTAPQKKDPVFDPYFNTFVDPDTRMPVKPHTPGSEADIENQMQNPAQQQFNQQGQPPAQGWQPPQQQAPQQPQGPQYGNYQPGQYQPQAQSTHPYQNPYGQQFQLPGQGVNNPAPPTHQAHGNRRVELSLEATDADLEAFEKQFGDIPL